MKKKTHKLSIKEVFDFKLIGISSHENDYRVSWAINQYLNFNLTKTDNHIAFNEKKGEKQEFSLFIFEDEDNFLKYILVSNRCDDGFLLQELKNIDFFLQVHGDYSIKEFEGLVDKLRGIDIILTTIIIDPNKLKSRKSLIIH